VITLGQTETDNINQTITLTEDCCLGEIGRCLVTIKKDESWQHLVQTFEINKIAAN